MRRRISALIPLALLVMATFPAVADDTHAVIPPMDGKAITETYQGKGRVNSVDTKAGRVNLSHGPVAGLDLPGTPMDIVVQDKTALSRLKPGQKIKFKLMEVRKGQYEISEISAVK